MTTDDVQNHYALDVKALCRHLEITRRTWYNWRDRGIPIHVQESIAYRTGGRLRPERAR